jgi:hypothetical protein
VGLAYFFVSEVLTGQTVGKRITGLRVVRLDGGPLNIAAVAARSVLLPVDALGLYLVGLLAMTLTPHRQRLGDLLAGTVVTDAADHPHQGSVQRGRTALLVAYPAVWIGAALWTTAGIKHDDAAARYRLQAATICQGARSAMSGATGVDALERAILVTDGVERQLSALHPPSGLGGVHARLLAVQHRDGLEFRRAVRRLRGARHRADVADVRARLVTLGLRDVRELSAAGLAACA